MSINYAWIPKILPAEYCEPQTAAATLSEIRPYSAVYKLSEMTAWKNIINTLISLLLCCKMASAVLETLLWHGRPLLGVTTRKLSVPVIWTERVFNFHMEIQATSVKFLSTKRDHFWNNTSFLNQAFFFFIIFLRKQDDYFFFLSHSYLPIFLAFWFGHHCQLWPYLKACWHFTRIYNIHLGNDVQKLNPARDRALAFTYVWSTW